MAYERIWTKFLAWVKAAGFDPRSLSFPTALEAYRFLGEGKNAASLKQIRAALSFSYKHRDFKNPFAKIELPLQNEPQIRYLLLSDIRRLMDYLKARQQEYGSALAFHLANALFQTRFANLRAPQSGACRFDELIQLTWGDCQAVGKEIVALRIEGKGSVFQDVPVPERLSAALLDWQALQEDFKGRRILAPGGINFAASQYVFAGNSRIAPTQEYPHHRSLHPRWLSTDPADEPGFGMKGEFPSQDWASSGGLFEVAEKFVDTQNPQDSSRQRIAARLQIHRGSRPFSPTVFRSPSISDLFEAPIFS